jgi:hypothetical protein
MGRVEGRIYARARLGALLLLASWLWAGCGAISVGFVSNPQIPSTSTTGTITAVSLGSVNDLNGNPLTVTNATFVNGGLSSILTFCGDQRPRLPIHAIVRADFAMGNLCDTLVNAVVVG